MDSNSLEKLKQEYNRSIERYKKAETYLGKCTEEEFQKWYPAFNEIIIQLSSLMKEYEKLTGAEMGKETVLNGFN